MKIKDIIESKNFLIFCCLIIFSISILLRSLIDIGSDTAVYIDLGRRIAAGQKYYYNFFENNFPLSFYFYALEHQAATLFHINPIIMSEIAINLLALASIFWSSQILKNTTIYQNKAHYNLIIIAFFLGFFLRPVSIQIAEFGTKTSLLFITLYPYLSYSFVRTKTLSVKDMIYRGVLMGIIPCIKPHYLIFILLIEINSFWQTKSLKSLYRLDNIVMCLIGALYLIFMVNFTLGFLSSVIPMAADSYSAYNNYHTFLDNAARLLAIKISIFSLIFLIFSRLPFSKNDKILTLLFAGAAILLILESIATYDQLAIFYSLITVCFVKFSYDLFSSNKFSFPNHKFIVIALIFLPLWAINFYSSNAYLNITTSFFLPTFNDGDLPFRLFCFESFIKICWIIASIYPLIIIQKLKNNRPQEWLKFKAQHLSIRKIIAIITLYCLMILSALLILKFSKREFFITFNIAALFIILFFFEKKIYAKFFPHFSAFFTFVIMTSCSALLYSYITSASLLAGQKHTYTTPNQLNDSMAFYIKTYAPKPEDKVATFSIWIRHGSPLQFYFDKKNDFKFVIYSLNASSSRWHMSGYFFSDAKEQLKNPQTKVLFFNNDKDVLNKDHRCLISSVEFYLSDKEFRETFLKNFHFKNRILTNKNGAHDFEVYVKNEN